MPMNTPDFRTNAENNRNLIERIGHAVPGFRGYLEKEERRNSDRLLREHLAQRLDRLREKLDPVMRDITNRGGFGTLGLVNELDRVKKALERLVARIRYASYGYSGLFDVDKVKEPELDKLYEFDVALVERINQLEEAMTKLTEPDTGDDALKNAVQQTLTLSREFDEHLDARSVLITGAK